MFARSVVHAREQHGRPQALDWARQSGAAGPHVRHIRGQLWEFRLKGKAGIARALYVTAKEQRVVIVRAFIKRTEKTPAGEIARAFGSSSNLRPLGEPRRTAFEELVMAMMLIALLAVVLPALQTETAQTSGT